jgi:uncharacterized protein (TIGR02611 family)
MAKDPESAISESLSEAWRHARRTVVFVVGCSIVLIGLALVVLPGPATVVIPLGLAILATEFVWARRLLRKAREQGAELVEAVVGNGQESDANPRDKEPVSDDAKQDERGR